MKRLTLDEKQYLQELYKEANTAVDRLPYTRSFESIYQQFSAASFREFNRSELFRALLNLRKRKELSRKVA